MIEGASGRACPQDTGRAVRMHGARVVLATWLVALCALAAGCAAPTPPYVGLAKVIEVTARDEATGPRVLAVVAHPDDEIAFAGTLYKTTTGLDGVCDVLTITNGEGGYKYSTLAESLYDLPLTDEAVGRAELPDIRERELVEGLGYLGIRRLFMLRQRDHRYTTDEGEILETEVWDLPGVHDTLLEVLRAGEYDVLLTHFPGAGTHGHHKAATILALRAWSELDEGARPAALGVRLSSTTDSDVEDGLPTRPLTPARTDVGPWRFDRLRKFGRNDRLDYRIIATWAIAAHKSQGTMQLLAGHGEQEDYVLYAVAGEAEVAAAEAFFTALDEAPDPGETAEEAAAEAEAPSGEDTDDDAEPDHDPAPAADADVKVDAGGN